MYTEQISLAIALSETANLSFEFGAGWFFETGAPAVSKGDTFYAGAAL